MMLDRRLNVFRSDLADEKLQGVVQAERFVSGSPAQIAVPVIGLRPTPDLAAGIDTELLFGETVRIFDRANGWAQVQADADGYAGYVPETAIGDVVAVTHRGCATHLPLSFRRIAQTAGRSHFHGQHGPDRW